MANNQLELDDHTYSRIQLLSAEGDDLSEVGKYDGALEKYNSAWELMPEPRKEWEASTWVLTAIADVAFKAGYFTSAREALDYAMLCPDAIGNPFIHLRRGQVLFEQGEREAAVQELLRAYMGGGDEIFSEDDPKYSLFLRSRVEL